jgi:hypothetical protein
VNRFCLECGAKANSSDLICTECGTKFVKETVVKNSRTPMTKKNKVIILIAMLFISVLGGLYLFGNSYASAENTMKRFHEAVVDKDNSALKKLVEFEGGTELSNGELDAINAFGEKEPNKFTKSIGTWGDESESFLFSVKRFGKVFGIFDGYKIIVQNQFVSVPFPYEELEYTLNGEKSQMKLENGRAIIGPLSPGIYELNAEYKGEYAEFSQSKAIELLDLYSGVVDENIAYDISKVTFELNYSYGTDPSKTKLVIGKNEFAFDKEGYIKALGPFPMDGSIKVKVVSEFSSGEIETEDIEVKENYISININGLNNDVEEGLVDTELANGEWGGYWQIENEQIDGGLSIYDETEEGFYFDIHVSSGHVGAVQNVYALKDGNVAKSNKDEYGCEITLTKNDGGITSEEGPDCWAWHGAGINFNHTFKFEEGGLIQFVIDEELLDIVNQGYLVKGTYPLGTKLKKIIDEKGAYDQVENLQGATYHFYGNGIGYGTFIYDEVDEVDVISIMVGSAQDYTPEEIISYLGEPSYEFEDESEGYGLIVGYSFENGYELQFRYEINSDRLGSVVLTDKGN